MKLYENATRNEPIMGIFCYFFPKLNKYKDNVKIVLTSSNTWLVIAGLSGESNPVSCRTRVTRFGAKY